MFWNILSIENTKNLRRALLWVELIALALLVVLIITFLYIATQSSLPENVTISSDDLHQIPQLVTWPGALTFALQSAAGSSLGVLLLVVFVGAVTAQEYTWHTLRLWLSRGVPRPLLVIAKFAALIVPALALVLAALFSGAGISAVFSWQINGSLHLDQLDILQLCLSILRTAYTLMPYAALTFLLAIASRSAVIAVGGGLAFAMFLESIVMQMLQMGNGILSKLAAYLPAALSDILLNLNQTMIKGGNVTRAGSVTNLSAILGIAAWTCLFVGLSLWIFQRQDLTD